MTSFVGIIVHYCFKKECNQVVLENSPQFDGKLFDFIEVK